MTKIKLCGISRPCDIEAANELKTDYVGFVFAEKSRRYVSPSAAEKLKAKLSRDIRAVGVFVNESPETIADLLGRGVIDMAQLHGDEDDAYIRRLRALTDQPIIQAFVIRSEQDAAAADQSAADWVLLDAGAGTGAVFDWELIKNVRRPYFLAGGLTPDNVGYAVRRLRPFAVDVSSGVETDGLKDKIKTAAFVAAVRKEDKQ
ncbi:MAG: phosphoribosylanthranilate isomerase [Acutalibacteraceae bacterium]